MKKTLRFLAMILSAATVTFFVACDTDTDDPEPDPDPEPSINLPNGVYIVGSAVSTDTTAANQLLEGTVEAPDFGAQTRSGMYQGYLYMEAGSFSFIKVTNGEAAAFGGEPSAVEDAAETSPMFAGAFTADGTGSSPLTEGKLVHVTFDESSGEFVLVPVNYFEVIGAATDLGWNSGTEIPQKSASAAEVVFEATNMNLTSGNEMKFRYNSIWNINREQGECDNAATACFEFFTNFGGAVDALVPGGSNINFAEQDGAYTVTITYTPGAGNSLAASLQRTGDIVQSDFDPADYAWGVIGDGTAGGWDSDRDLFYKGVDGTKGHWWAGVVYLAETGTFKFRINNEWAFDVTGALTSDGTPVALAQGPDNIAVPGTAGAYYVELYTADEGGTWTGTMVPSGWGVIGDGSPQGNWDADVDMTANGFADGVTTYSITGDFTTAEWKFRANNDWAINLGGDFTGLSLDGGNFTLDAAGTYTVTLSVALDQDGNTVYSATVE